MKIDYITVRQVENGYTVGVATKTPTADIPREVDAPELPSGYVWEEKTLIFSTAREASAYVQDVLAASEAAE